MAVMLLYHAEIPWAQGAFLALSQFFTLSGFLVMWVLLQGLEHGGSLDVRRFWTRRVRRLWPASLAGLALVSVFGATVADAGQAAALPKQVTAAVLNVSNWLFIVEDTSYVHQFAAPSPVQHFWSLSVEEQFYLLLPLGLAGILWFSRSRRVLGIVFAVVGVACTARMIDLALSGASVDRIYYGTDTRMPEILTGVLTAVVLSAVRLRLSSRFWVIVAWAGAAAYAVTLWMFATLDLTEPIMWRGGIVAFSLVSCLVILGVLGDVGPLRLLAVYPLAAMGRISYGLYVYHLPIYLWLTSERTGLSQWPLLGLRLGVTFAVAIASYHLLEMPIRSGALNFGRFRMVVGPATAVSIVAVTVLTTGRAADDPFATLRGEDSLTERIPTAALDPVLDVLVITDRAGDAIAGRLEEVAASDESLEVVGVGSFDCGLVVRDRRASTCGAWLDTWPSLVEALDPDVVFLYTDTRAADDLAVLAENAGTTLTEVVEGGVDLLSTNDAPVVWGSEPEGLRAIAHDETRPFREVMESLLHSRRDVRATDYLPEVPASPDDAYLARATGTVLEALKTYRRAPERAAPRIMIVGDSQAKSIGYGLERLESDTGGAVVWNLATPGCGIVQGGTVRGDVAGPGDDACVRAIDAWPSNVSDFDPDIVVVLSSVRDVEDRRIDGAADFGAIGDDAIDDYLVAEYTKAVDTLSARGAKVVWLQPPCLRYVSPFGGDGRAPSEFDPVRTRRLSDDVLPAVAHARPDDVVLYPLDEILCPDGNFLEDAGGMTNIRPDGVHLSTDAARWVAEVLHRDVVERYG